MEAVRRLGIESRMFMVTRRPGSVVEVRKSLDPVRPPSPRLRRARRSVENAPLLVYTTDLPESIVPTQCSGFCLARLNKYGTWAGDAFKQCNEGAHKEYAGDLQGLINDTEKLAERLQAL